MIVAGELRERLIAGEWAAGERLPSETTLAAHYGVSRATIRGALKRLEDANLIRTQHGRGSFATNLLPSIETGLHELRSMSRTIRNAGHDPGVAYRKRELRMPTGVEMERLQISRTTSVLYLERSILSDGNSASPHRLSSKPGGRSAQWTEPPRGSIEEMLEIGSSLREARMRRGLELPEVEAAILIRGRYIEALEREQFELLPTGSYRRSFLREYAEFLGLDGDIYADEYDLRLASLEPEPPSPVSYPGSVLVRLLRELPLTRTFFVASAVALVAIAVWLFGGSSGTALVKTTRPGSQTHAHTPANAHHPAATPPAATSQPAPRRPPPLLTLTAAGGSCWLSVRVGSSSGPTVYEQTLQPGQTVRFGMRKPLWIRLGAPWNLAATIGSRPVTAALPSRTGDLLATPAGLRPSP